MKISIERWASLIVTTIVVCSVAYGVDSVVEQPARVEVGKRKEQRTSKSLSRNAKTNRSKDRTKICVKCLPDGYYIPRYQPTYYIKSIGADGDTLTMTDETVWKIAESSAYTAARWIENSPIVITPSRWYSKYDYYITNKITNESVTAKLSQGPFVKYSVFIQQIDWHNGLVSLTNGTRWHASVDKNFYYWQVGQAVLLGENTGWSSQDYILININENTYVSANRLP